MSWGVLLLVMMVGIALLAVPGLLVLHLFGMDWTRSAVFSLPVGTGLIGIIATISGFSGLRWTWWQPAALTVVLLVLEMIAHLSWRPRKDSSTKVNWLALALGVAGVLIYVVMFMRSFLSVVDSPNEFPRFGDAAFHLQATQLMDSGGSVNPFGGLGPMYDPLNPGNPYYPTLWHALTVLLVPITGLVPATNAMMIVVSVLIWPVGLVALVWVVRPTATLGPLGVTLLASFVVMFPTIQSTSYAIYPFTLSIAILPGAIALLLYFVETRSVAAVVGVAFAWIGMALAQPSTAVIFLLVLMALALVKLFGVWGRWIAGGSPGLVVVTAGSVVSVIVAFFIFIPTLDYVQSLGAFSRDSLGYTKGFSDLVTGVAAVSWPWKPWVVVAALGLVGVLLSLGTERGRTLAIASGFFTILYMAAAGPENWLRLLTGPWYKDMQRLSVPVIMVTIVFAALAIGVFTQWLTNRLPAKGRDFGLVLGAVVLIGASAFAYTSQNNLIGTLKHQYISLGYALPDAGSGSLDADELGVLEASDWLGLQPGSRVIGLPSSGVPFASVVSNLGSFVPISWPSSADQRYVTANFDAILTDPEVCRILNDYEVVAYLESPDSQHLVAREDRDYSGMQNVDTSEGFSLIAEESNARLWLITACE